MNWYDKLNGYFPTNEMKSQMQLNALLSEKHDLYYKDEGLQHIMMYAKFDSFLFIDFLWVSEKSRGSGIGHQLIEKLKSKNKSILLEAEPVAPQDPDTEKRLRFYRREGFKHAKPIDYWFQAFKSNSETQLDIWYWTKYTHHVSEWEIYEYMREVYEQIHSYKAKEIYGYTPKPTNEIIHFNEK